MLLSGKFVVFPFIYEQDCSNSTGKLLNNGETANSLFIIFYFLFTSISVVVIDSSKMGLGKLELRKSS